LRTAAVKRVTFEVRPLEEVELMYDMVFLQYQRVLLAISQALQIEVIESAR
jgi:hypothetical protein